MMRTQAAVQTGAGERLVLEEIELPDPGPGQVLVKLYSSGVCHSQLHQMRDTGLPRPLLLGHEATGVVTAAGAGVEHLKEGDKAIVTWVPRVPIEGRPPWQLTGAKFRGEPAHAHVFTWTRDVLTSADYVVAIPEEHPNDLSCIVGCAVLTGAGAVIHTANVRPGESVAVYGVGGVGLSAIQAAAIVGAYPIIAVDLEASKLDFAREFGATHVVNASETDPVEAILDLTGGGVDYAFDAIGVRQTCEQVLPSTRGGGMRADNRGGTAVVIGIPPKEVTIDALSLVRGQRRLAGSLGATYPDRDFPMFLRWHQEGKFPLDRLVTRRYPLEQINEACDDLRAGKILGRAIVEY